MATTEIMAISFCKEYQSTAEKKINHSVQLLKFTCACNHDGMQLSASGEFILHNAARPESHMTVQLRRHQAKCLGTRNVNPAIIQYQLQKRMWMQSTLTVTPPPWNQSSEECEEMLPMTKSEQSMQRKLLRSLTQSKLYTNAIHHHPGNAFGT